MIKVLLDFYANFHSGLIEIALCFTFITGCKNRNLYIFLLFLKKIKKRVKYVYYLYSNF
jgi:hypothetical protein